MNQVDDFINEDIAGIPDDMSITPTGGNLASLEDLKPKDMPKSIMSVYHQLGGDSWLLKQAELYPKEFMTMLKSILPKNVNIDLDQNINVSIAGSFSSADLEGQIGVVGNTRSIING